MEIEDQYHEVMYLLEDLLLHIFQQSRSAARARSILSKVFTNLRSFSGPNPAKKSDSHSLKARSSFVRMDLKSSRTCLMMRT